MLRLFPLFHPSKKSPQFQATISVLKQVESLSPEVFEAKLILPYEAEVEQLVELMNLSKKWRLTKKQLVHFVQDILLSGIRQLRKEMYLAEFLHSMFTLAVTNGEDDPIRLIPVTNSLALELSFDPSLLEIPGKLGPCGLAGAEYEFLPRLFRCVHHIHRLLGLQGNDLMEIIELWATLMFHFFEIAYERHVQLDDKPDCMPMPPAFYAEMAKHVPQSLPSHASPLESLRAVADVAAAKLEELIVAGNGIPDWSTLLNKTYCDQCGKRPGIDDPGLKVCSRCRTVHYCSAGCQKQAWKTHKAKCVPYKPGQNQ